MVLYSADLFDDAKLVTKPAGGVRKPRKGKESKDVEDTPIPEVGGTYPAAPAKPKRVLSDAQRAALLKGQETRKRKREEAVAAKAAEEAATSAAAIATQEALRIKAEKVEAAKERRKAARAANKAAASASSATTPSEGCTSMDAAIDNAVEALNTLPPKKRRAKLPQQPVPAEKTSLEPPAWFKNYIQGVKKEENYAATEKKPQKVLKEESAAVATEKWNDGAVRDRVRSEQDRHFANTYSMIFGTAGRRIK